MRQFFDYDVEVYGVESKSLCRGVFAKPNRIKS